MDLNRFICRMNPDVRVFGLVAHRSTSVAWKSKDEGMVRPSASAASGAFYAPHAGEGTQILQIKSGSWPVLVKRGNSKVSQRFPVHGKVRKTVPLLRENSGVVNLLTFLPAP